MKRLLFALVVAACALNVGPAGAATTKERVLQEHRITVGIHNSAPWAYHDAGGHVLGYHADVVRAVFAPLGVKDFNFVTADFPSLIPGLLAQKFDLVASGLVITPQRCKLVAFGDPDLSSRDGLLVKKGNPLHVHSYADIAKDPKFRLGGTRGSQQAKNASNAGISPDQMQAYQDTESTFAALLSGRVDGIVFTSGTANHLLASATGASALERAEPFSGRVTSAGAPNPDALGTAFRLADKDLADLYDRQLAILKADGTLRKLMVKNGFSAEDDPPTAGAATICAN